MKTRVQPAFPNRGKLSAVAIAPASLRSGVFSQTPSLPGRLQADAAIDCRCPKVDQ